METQKLGILRSTVNYFIKKFLDRKLRKKSAVHHLLLRHKKIWKTNSRKLYKKHLSGIKGHYVVTLDEAWIYEHYTNGIWKVCYIKRDQKVLISWIKPR